MAGFGSTSRVKVGLVRIFIILTVITVATVLIYYQTFTSSNDLTKEKPRNSALKEWVASAESVWANKTMQRNQILRKYPIILKGGGDIVQFFHLFSPTYTCPFKVDRVGRAGDGGKWICGVNQMTPAYQEKPCILYSFGVNDDSSFESEILDRVNCRVFAYDPTVSQIAAPLHSNDPRVKFEKLGLSSVDDVPPGYRTLKALMKQNGHQWIDILKMDVEGYEFDSLLNIMDDFPKLLPFGQLLFEVHVWKPEYRPKFVKLFDELERRGMRAYYYEPNPNLRVGCEYSFLNTQFVK